MCASGVLFWFALLGPLGAVLYRAVTQLRQQCLQDQDEFAWATRQLAEIMDWLPARLAALGFALSGDFEGAVARWRDLGTQQDQWLVPAAAVLSAAGAGALNLQDDETAGSDAVLWDRLLTAALSLVWRTLFLWVVLIALLTLAGWAG